MTSAPADTWRHLLSESFGAFLGRPLEKFDADAEYGAYYWAGNFLNEVGFASDAAWVDPEALAGRVPVADDNIVMYDEGEAPLRFDASTSVFVFEEDSELPADFVAALNEAGFSERLILGRDLAALLDQHPVDLTDDAFAGAWYVLYPRIASDGTLVDALRAATGVGEGPDTLVPFDGDPAEEWETSLSQVEHPGLREHLSFGCQEAGEAGLYYVGADSLSFWGLTREGGTVIAAWDETQNQVEIAVIQLAGALTDSPIAPDRA